MTISTSPDNSHCPKVRETSSEMMSSHSTGLETVSANESIDNPDISISDSSTLQTAVSDPCTHRDSELQMSDASKTTASDQGVVAGPSFSQEQQHRFQVRYEEGFDIADDSDYVSWLRINHPDSHLLQHPTGPQTSALPSESVLHHFSDVTPLQEIAVDSPNTESDTSKTPSTSALSKFLIPTQASKRRAASARLLTSTAALEILKEKERKKTSGSRDEREKKEGKGGEKEKGGERTKKKAEERAKKQELKAKVRAEGEGES